jgi:hypothetical protein
MLALTLPTSGGRSVGIVRSLTEATEFVSLFVCLFLFCSHKFSLIEILPLVFRAYGPLSNVFELSC